MNEERLRKLELDIINNPNVDSNVEAITQFFDTASNNCMTNCKSNANNKKQRKNCKTFLFDSECYRKRTDINRLGKLMVKFPNNPCIRKTYHHNKEEYKHMCKKKQRNRNEKLLRKLENIKENGIKERWNVIKSCTQNVEQGFDPTTEIQQEQWISHFKSLGFCENQEALQHIPIESLKVNKQPSHSVLLEIKEKLNMDISTQEILTSCNKLKRNKAVGYDNICNEMIKLFGNLRLGTQILRLLFNKIFGEYPETWKTGLIKPIHKNGNKLNPQNYRGITLTSCCTSEARAYY